MKINFVPRNGSPRTLRGAVATAALLLLSGLSALGQNAHDPTTVDWDCVMSGAREGLAQISFSNNFSFSTFEVLVPKALKSASGSGTDGRSNGGDDSRGGSGTASTSNSRQ